MLSHILSAETCLDHGAAGLNPAVCKSSAQSNILQRQSAHSNMSETRASGREESTGSSLEASSTKEKQMALIARMLPLATLRLNQTYPGVILFTDTSRMMSCEQYILIFLYFRRKRSITQLQLHHSSTEEAWFRP